MGLLYVSGVAYHDEDQELIHNHRERERSLYVAKCADGNVGSGPGLERRASQAHELARLSLSAELEYHDLMMGAISAELSVIYASEARWFTSAKLAQERADELYAKAGAALAAVEAEQAPELKMAAE